VNLCCENLIILTDLPKKIIDFWKNYVQIDHIKVLSFHTSICLHGGNVIFLNRFTILTRKFVKIEMEDVRIFLTKKS